MGKDDKVTPRPGVMTGADADALFKGLDVAPTVVTLVDGEAVGGTFLRWGQIMGAPKEDRLTGEVKASPMRSLVIKTKDRGTVEILSSHDIDRVLHAVTPGAKVAIQRLGKDEDAGVVRYKVAGG